MFSLKSQIDIDAKSQSHLTKDVRSYSKIIYRNFSEDVSVKICREHFLAENLLLKISQKYNENLSNFLFR